MQNYNVSDTKDVLKKYFYRPYKRDVEAMFINLVEFYNGYVKTRPYASKVIRRYANQDTGGITTEKSKTMTINKFRNPISRHHVRDNYTLDDITNIYFLLRTYELNSKMSEFAKRDIMETALKRRRVFGFDSAISFINQKLVDEAKIDLTIATNYVKGNNGLAKQIENARSDNKFNKEPSVKDVISGDYGRK